MQSNLEQKNIPKGWQRARLGDVCSIVESIKTTEGEKNYLEIGDIDISIRHTTYLVKTRKQ